MDEKTRSAINEEEFVLRAVKRLRKPPYKGIHTVYSGFNQAFKGAVWKESGRGHQPYGRGGENRDPAGPGRRDALPAGGSAGIPQKGALAKILSEESDLRERLRIGTDRLDEINALLLDPQSRVVNDLLKVVAKYGTRRRSTPRRRKRGSWENLLSRLERENSPYLADLKWLIAQREAGAFITWTNTAAPCWVKKPPR